MGRCASKLLLEVKGKSIAAGAAGVELLRCKSERRLFCFSEWVIWLECFTCGTEAELWHWLRVRCNLLTAREQERRTKKQAWCSEKEARVVSDGHTESERDVRKKSFLPFFFLLGSVQNSPTGEQLDLKRRLVPPACVCVCVIQCVLFQKDRDWWSQLATAWSQIHYPSRPHTNWYTCKTNTHTLAD